MSEIRLFSAPAATRNKTQTQLLGRKGHIVIHGLQHTKRYQQNAGEFVFHRIALTEFHSIPFSNPTHFASEN